MSHLEEEEIALFVEGKLDDAGGRRVAAHLQTCAQCRQEYKAAVLMSWFWRKDQDSFTPAADVVEEGMKVAGNRSAVPASARPRRGARAWHWRWTTPVAAAAVVMVAVSVWLGVGRRGELPAADPALEPIYEVARTVSSSTDFVLPGTEDDFRPEPAVYRSGNLSQDRSVTEALIHLTDKKHSGRASRDELYWLTAGFVAADQLLEASISARDALALYPRDGDFLTLSAIIECLRGDCATSRRLLSGAQDADPDDAVTRLNFAVVLLRTGERAGAAAVLKGIIAAEPDSPLARRARFLLP